MTWYLPFKTPGERIARPEEPGSIEQVPAPDRPIRVLQWLILLLILLLVGLLVPGARGR